jgi:hypothetical protein
MKLKNSFIVNYYRHFSLCVIVRNLHAKHYILFFVHSLSYFALVHLFFLFFNIFYFSLILCLSVVSQMCLVSPLNYVLFFLITCGTYSVSAFERHNLINADGNKKLSKKYLDIRGSFYFYCIFFFCIDLICG